MPGIELCMRMNVQIVGEELSPGIKKGGHLNLVQRTVKCMGPASAIPESIEIDISSLDFGQRIYPSGVAIPPGVSTVGLVSGHCLQAFARRLCYLLSLLNIHVRCCKVNLHCNAGGGAAALQVGWPCRTRLMTDVVCEVLPLVYYFTNLDLILS